MNSKHSPIRRPAMNWCDHGPLPYSGNTMQQLDGVPNATAGDSYRPGEVIVLKGSPSDVAFVGDLAKYPPSMDPILYNGERTVKATDKYEPVTLEAAKLVAGDRAKSYGPALKDFDKIARIWSVILGVPVTAEQAALCMIGVKLSREIHTHKRDNLVDIAGYAEVVNSIVEERAGRKGKADA